MYLPYFVSIINKIYDLLVNCIQGVKTFKDLVVLKFGYYRWSFSMRTTAENDYLVKRPRMTTLSRTTRNYFIKMTTLSRTTRNYFVKNDDLVKKEQEQLFCQEWWLGKEQLLRQEWRLCQEQHRKTSSIMMTWLTTTRSGNSVNNYNERSTIAWWQSIFCTYTTKRKPCVSKMQKSKYKNIRIFLLLRVRLLGKGSQQSMYKKLFLESNDERSTHNNFTKKGLALKFSIYDYYKYLNYA